LILTEKVITAYSPHLFRLCYFLCQNEDYANDIFQETWIKIIRHIDKYDESRSFGKWASTVCVNTYRDMLRKNRKINFVEFADSGELEKFFNSLPDTAGDIAVREEYAVLYKAIGMLSAEKRAVTVLHYFLGYSEKECGQILGIGAKTVKSRLYNARQALKRSLEV